MRYDWYVIIVIEFDRSWSNELIRKEL